MERYNIPITVFVSPEETDRRQAWPKHIQRVKDKIGSVSMFDIAARERYAIIDKCNEGESKKYDLADWAELQCFAKCRLATIENHTNTHLSCSHRPIEEVILDVVLAKKRLHALKLSKGRLLCYPFGHVTDAVEENILALGIIPIRSDAGVMNISAPGRFRNQFHQHVTLQENIGRILGAWPASRLQHQ
jgi:peptidoglycan/xylan/chitin deacetylase (PgdA/CDA1 family)